MKKIILGALVAVLLLGGIGSMGGNKESGNSDSASSKEAVVEETKEEVKEEAVSDGTNNDTEEGQEKTITARDAEPKFRAQSLCLFMGLEST